MTKKPTLWAPSPPPQPHCWWTPKTAPPGTKSPGTVPRSRFNFSPSRLDVQNTTEPAVNDAVSQGTASGVIKRILSNGTTRTLMILPNDDNDFASSGTVTIADKKHEFQQLTTNSAFFAHAAGETVSQGGVNAFASRKDGAAVFVFNANTAFSAGASTTATVTADSDGQSISVADTTGLAQGMYLNVVSSRLPGIKITTVDTDNNTITLSSAVTVADQDSLTFVEALTRGTDEAQHRTTLDMTAKVAEGFLVPAVGDAVSQGASTGTVAGVAGGVVTISTDNAFTDTGLLSIGGTEQRFQQLTVADDSPLKNITDLTAVSTINDATASLIEQGNTQGRLRSYAGGVMTVQITNGTTFNDTDTLTFGGHTHRYATLTATAGNFIQPLPRLCRLWAWPSRMATAPVSSAKSRTWETIPFNWSSSTRMLVSSRPTQR